MSQQRYKTNPFIQDMVIPVKGKTVRLSVIGKDDNILVNQSTGEVLGGTHVASFKKVDGEQFIKLFTQNIALTFGLSSSGIKTFNVLLWCVQHKALAKDEVDFDALVLEDFIAAHKEDDPPLKLSLATFKRGITELETAKIIAKTERRGRYFINPNLVFNGDRIAFTTIIERKRTTKTVDENQLGLNLE